MWEHTSYILSSNALRWWVIEFLSLATFQVLALSWHLFLNELIDLSLQLLVFFLDFTLLIIIACTLVILAWLLFLMRFLLLLLIVQVRTGSRVPVEHALLFTSFFDNVDFLIEEFFIVKCEVAGLLGGFSTIALPR